jgi:hypothetical protein
MVAKRAVDHCGLGRDIKKVPFLVAATLIIHCCVVENFIG